MPTRSIYQVLRVAGDVKAASRGPGALARREVRRHANRTFNGVLRRLVRP